MSDLKFFKKNSWRSFKNKPKLYKKIDFSRFQKNQTYKAKKK